MAPSPADADDGISSAADQVAAMVLQRTGSTPERTDSRAALLLGVAADLPGDVLSNILGHAPWASRQVCRAFRASHDNEVESLVVQWDALLPSRAGRLRNMLARLPQLTALSCAERPKFLNELQKVNIHVGWLSTHTKLRSLSISGYRGVTGIDDILASCPHLAALDLREVSYEGRATTQHPFTLAALTQLTSLSLSLSQGGHAAAWCRCIRPLSVCTKLVTLTLGSSEEVQDVAPLAALTRLTSLVLSRCPSSISPLSTCTGLAALTLGTCRQLEVIGVLTAFMGLAALSLKGCTCVVDLSALQTCARLTTLDLQGCTRLASIRGLRACTAVVRFNLRGCSNLMLIDPLMGCAALEEVEVDGCSSLRDVWKLTKCSSLVLLSADERALHYCGKGFNLSSLQRLDRLRLHLECEWGPAAVAKMTAGCTKLSSLEVWWSRNGGPEWGSFMGFDTKCPALSEIVVVAPDLADISGFAACPALRSLHLIDCRRLTDLMPLSVCRHLNSLSFDGRTPLDISALAHCLQLVAVPPIQP